MNNTEIIILAAGKGTRMGNIKIPKCLVPLKGIPMLQRLLSNTQKTLINKPIIVIGHLGDKVKEYFGDNVKYSIQTEQKGTGHAASIALNDLSYSTKNIVVLYADHPFVTSETVEKLVAGLDTNYVVMATTDAGDITKPESPFKHWGRIIYSNDGKINGIVEYKDASEEIKKINTVNPGFYAFRLDWFKQAIKNIKPLNAQGEYYLTDVIHITKQANHPIGEVKINPIEAIGLNSKTELEYAETLIK